MGGVACDEVLQLLQVWCWDGIAKYFNQALGLCFIISIEVF